MSPIKPGFVPQHLVWIQTSFLGDIILTTGAMKLARRMFPQAKQWLITTQSGCVALRGSPYLDGLIRFSKKEAGFFMSLRETRHKLRELIGPVQGPIFTLQVHRSFRSSLLAKYLGYPVVTYQESNLSFLAQWRVFRVAPLHEAARIGMLLEPLGVSREEIVQARPALESLPLNEEGFFWEKDILKFKHRLVGVAPGSVWGTKRWPIEGYAHVVSRLLNETDVGIVVIGTQDESAIARELENRIPESLKKRFWNLAGKTSLDDLRRLYPRLSLVLTNDSSPIHYASAFNIPTVAIFGPTVPSMGFGPLADRSIAIGMTNLTCRPCSDHGPQVCPLGHFQCMRRINPDGVFQACWERLQN